MIQEDSKTLTEPNSMAEIREFVSQHSGIGLGVTVTAGRRSETLNAVELAFKATSRQQACVLQSIDAERGRDKRLDPDTVTSVASLSPAAAVTRFDEAQLLSELAARSMTRQRQAIVTYLLDNGGQRTADRALNHVVDLVDDHPENGTVFIPTLLARLRDEPLDGSFDHELALSTLASIVEKEPTIVAPYSCSISEHLKNDRSMIQSHLLDFLRAVGGTTPRALQGCEPGLAAVIEDTDNDTVALKALQVLNTLSEVTTVGIESHVATLSAFLQRDDVVSRHRNLILQILSRLDRFGLAATDAVRATVDCLLSEAEREQSALVTRRLAQLSPAAVAESLDTIMSVLEQHETAYDLSDATRMNLICALIFVTKEMENELTDQLDCVLSFSTDPEPGVRQNACMLLAQIDAQTAEQRLMELATDDPKRDVRATAREALQIFRRN